MVNYSMKEHLLYIKRKEKIFYPINFTLFHITLHVISWCATYGPPCICIADSAFWSIHDVVATVYVLFQFDGFIACYDKVDGYDQGLPVLAVITTKCTVAE